MASFEELEMMAQKAETLDELFGYWKAAHEAEYQESSQTNGKDGIPTLPKAGKNQYISSDFYKNFCPDGISSCGVKASSELQHANVLFILKESNVSAKTKNGSECAYNPSNDFWFNSHLDDSVRNNYSSYLSEALVRLYPNVDIKEIRFGYMNLNKRGGFSSADTGALKAYTNKYRNFILREIDIINPRVIIFCGATLKSVSDILFEAEKSRTIYYIYHPRFKHTKKCLKEYKRRISLIQPIEEDAE